MLKRLTPWNLRQQLGRELSCRLVCQMGSSRCRHFEVQSASSVLGQGFGKPHESFGSYHKSMDIRGKDLRSPALSIFFNKEEGIINFWWGELW